MDQVNPFALVRASDYTDEQINVLWVELGRPTINAIIEPQSKTSKYILGGKGTGKTHLLRYYSYQVSRLRNPEASGLQIVAKQKFLATFLRAASTDAPRFAESSASTATWQQLFGVYFELRLVEVALDALQDIKKTSVNGSFDDIAFCSEMAAAVSDNSVSECRTLDEFEAWVINERRKIDDAVNNAAYIGRLELRVPFSIGRLCLPLSRAIGKWSPSLAGIPLIYLIDEIENFSVPQQQVVNTLIRYGEGLATFRVTGRLYARKTFSTLLDGEENREGSEFRTIILDEILRNYHDFLGFAKKFVTRRLAEFSSQSSARRILESFDPSVCFEDVGTDHFYEDALSQLGVHRLDAAFANKFGDTYATSSSATIAHNVTVTLTEGLPLLLQRLNILLFCKKHGKKLGGPTLAERIRNDSFSFMESGGSVPPSYKTAYNHYAADLFAQLCRKSERSLGVPYAGFDTFVKMSSGNPRNLLIVLGKAYEIAVFKEIDFINGPKLPAAIQTQAAIEAAKFMYEQDSNYGTPSEQARVAVTRLASLLRAARYALNIPEASPLAVSFSEDDLSSVARGTLSQALNYSFVYELHGRPDRNSQRVNRKIQLNPLLSPRWGLPYVVRGDLGLTKELANAIFDPQRQEAFDELLKVLDGKWNSPFAKPSQVMLQDNLF